MPVRTWGVSAIGLVCAVALVAVASLGLFGIAAALSVAIGVGLLAALGTDRLGASLVLLALFTAPMNSVRPVASADFVTFSDLFFLLGMGLLVPTLLRQRARPPTLFLLGAGGVLVFVLISSLLSTDPVVSLNYGGRLVAAVVVLPTLFLLWRPDKAMIDRLAWSYVLGHVLSTAYCFVEGQALNNRYDGLTTHFNFFGIAAIVSTALLVHLHWSQPDRRLAVWAAGMVCLLSVILSGSRGAALVVVMVALLYPLAERSLASAYLLVAGALALVIGGDRLLTAFGQGSVFARLSGDQTTTYADNERIDAFNLGVEQFSLRPLRGNGFDAGALDAHNIYLQVAIGIGILGTVAFVLVLGSAIRPLIGTSPLRRLAYVPLAYAAIGMLTNSLWDRFVWLAISLAIVASVLPEATEPEDPESTDAADPDAADADTPADGTGRTATARGAPLQRTPQPLS